MTTIESPMTRNGVDTAMLFATLDAVKSAPQAAQFQFRAHNHWVNGTNSRSEIGDYFGVGEERSHERTWVFNADHPAVLCGTGQGRHPGRVRAARPRLVPHRRPGEHRCCTQGDADARSARPSAATSI